MDWLQFFDDHGVDYVLRGPNVKSGNVNIACPFCGDDPSHHMGVNLSNENWGCWRASNHAGRKAPNLVKAVLACSYLQAKMIVDQYSRADPENLDDALAGLLAFESPPAAKFEAPAKPLNMPPAFKPIKAHGTTAKFYNYLKNRGFKDVDKFCKTYNLRAASTGKWGSRIIIPIYINKELVSWTSRAIGKVKDAPRYLALSELDEDFKSKVNVFHALLNFDKLQKGGKVLFVCEGPFDALKIDYYGRKYGAQATCTFGTAMSVEQAYKISELVSLFDQVVLLYDASAVESIFLASDKLMHTKVIIGSLPKGVDDPGDLSAKQVKALIKKTLGRL